jgi:outer membrane protein OmpA-like peptidoglycan-associated protein
MKKKLAALSLLTLAQTAQAVNIQTFTFTQNPNFAIMEDALDPNSITNNNYKYLFTAAYHYVKNPLVILNSDGDRTGVAIDYFNTINIGFGYRMSAESLIGFETFASQAAFDDKKSWGMGDTSLTYKYRFTGKESPVAVAVVPKIFLPTGKEDLFLGDKSLGYGALVAMEKNLDYVQLAVNLGYTNSNDAKFANLDYRRKFITSIGGYIPFNDKWGGDIEFSRQNTFPIGDGPTPNEFFTGVRVQALDSQVYYGGIGWGDKGDSYGNDFRVVAGIKWTPPFYTEGETPEVQNLDGYKQQTEHGMLTQLKNIYFAHNSYALSESSQIILDEAAENMIERIKNVKVIHIEGYASQVGNAAYNVKISKLRATETRKYLIDRGVPGDKLKIVAFGAKKSTLDDYASNRRVEFRVFEK